MESCADIGCPNNVSGIVKGGLTFKQKQPPITGPHDTDPTPAPGSRGPGHRRPPIVPYRRNDVATYVCTLLVTRPMSGQEVPIGRSATRRIFRPIMSAS